MKLKLITTAIMLALGNQHGALAQDTYFFGDSLSDSGAFGSRFTTNPGQVWTQVFAARIGGSAVTSVAPGGTNFAVGGATVNGIGFPNNNPPIAAAPPLTTQVANYLAASGGSANPSALYSVMIGANDIFTLTNPPAAGGTFAGVAETISTGVQAAGATAAATIQGLSNAGARNITVINVPDIGKTPALLAAGAVQAAQLTQVTAGYNTALATFLSGNGTRALLLDGFTLFQEVVANPAAYGFANVTAPACGTTPSLQCGPANLVAPNADQTFLFADGVHPTTAGHALIADYVSAMYAIPAAAANLPNAGRANQVLVNQQLWRQSTRGLAEAPKEKGNLWLEIADGEGQLSDRDSDPQGISVGYDLHTEADSLLGFALDYQKRDGGNTVFQDADSNFLTGSVYLARRLGRFSLFGNLSMSSGDYNNRRQIKLGAHTRQITGDTSGHGRSAAVLASYDMGNTSIQHGPIGGLEIQSITVDGYTEQASDGSKSTSFTFGQQKRQSIIGSAGWQLSIPMGNWTPYGNIKLNKDFRDGRDYINAYTGNVGLYTPVNVNTSNDGYASVDIGARFNLTKILQFDAGLYSTLGSDDLQQYNLRVGLRALF